MKKIERNDLKTVGTTFHVFIFCYASYVNNGLPHDRNHGMTNMELFLAPVAIVLALSGSRLWSALRQFYCSGAI